MSWGLLGDFKVVLIHVCIIKLMNCNFLYSYFSNHENQNQVYSLKFNHRLQAKESEWGDKQAEEKL